MTPEELASLTEEERAGYEDDELDDDEGQDAADDAGDDAAADDGSDDADEDQPGRDDGADDKPAAAQQEEEPELDRPAPVNLINAQAPADVDAKLAALDASENDAAEKFDDGEMTAAEYRAELRRLSKERSDLEWQVRKAELADETRTAQIDQSWNSDCADFLAKHPEVMTNETRQSSFDAVVRKVTAESMNAGKIPGMADLNKAYKQWANDIGIAPVKADPKPGKASPGKREIPPTLGMVPAAGMTDTDSGEYAQLDRLMNSDPLAYEAALAKMSPAEADRYLQSQ